MIVTKPIDTVLLTTELATAGIVVPGLAIDELPTGHDLHTFDAEGTSAEMPPGSQPVVDAHVAPPRVIDFAAAEQIDAVKRTTDATPTVLLRFPLAVQTGYDVVATIMGVDAGNGAVKKLKVDVTMKRLNAGPSTVGTMTTTVTHQDTAASAWSVAFSFSGNDALVSVTGAAGRNIDWICSASVARFAPAGLVT